VSDASALPTFWPYWMGTIFMVGRWESVGNERLEAGMGEVVPDNQNARCSSGRRLSTRYAYNLIWGVGKISIG